MKATLEEVAMDALDLPSNDRALLARKLIESLDDAPAENPADVERAWQEEVERRLDDLVSGKVKAIPAEEVFAKLRAKYG